MVEGIAVAQYIVSRWSMWQQQVRHPLTSPGSV
jgi:hypothetical protein